jgi:hypothetical protein
MDLIRCRTASAEWAAPSPSRLDRGGEEEFQLEHAARRRDVFVRGHRLTVDSCMPMASATVFRFSGRRNSTPKARKASCWRTISDPTFRMVLARWSSDLTSQLAWAAQSATKVFSVSVRAPAATEP